jgi:hypothetical protein
MYQGFSPQLVHEHLQAVKQSKNISNTQFQSDMKMIILIGVIMGNYNDNNSNKITDQGKQSGDALMMKYELKKGGISQEKKVVNVPRVMAAFPIMTSKIALMVNPREYSGVYNSNLLPNFFKVSVSPSLIPRNLPSEVRMFLLNMCNVYLAEQTMAIRNMSNALEAYNFQWRYTEISHKSTEPSDDERTSHLLSFVLSYESMRIVTEIVNEKHKGTAGVLRIPGITSFTKAGLNIM